MKRIYWQTYRYRMAHKLAPSERNDFYIAEEVTIQGNLEKRPDIVLM
ncbi:MAG: hypothetical protein IPN89_11905 [Saprospiraceae bacterium]|nr:hypothetical protein [Saprospiraceae bacterium]